MKFFCVFSKNSSSLKVLRPTTWKKLENFWKSINTKEIKVKKKRKLWTTTEIHTSITFSHIFSQHVQMSSLKNQHAKNQVIWLNASFMMAFWKNKIKVRHTKIYHIFLRNKNASTEPHNYPINLFFFYR